MSTAEIASPLTLQPEALRCPHRYFDQLRTEAPVTWLEELECFAVTRYADVVDILRRPREFSSRRVGGTKALSRFNALAVELFGDSPELQNLLASAVMVAGEPVLLNADPPVHAQQRALVNRAFTPRRVQSLEPEMREIANALIDEFVDRGSCEFVREFAVGLPLLVISRTLGLPDEELPTLKAWSDNAVLGTGNHDVRKEDVSAMLRSTVEMFNYFTARIGDTRQRRTPGLIDGLVDAAASADVAQPDSALVGMLTQLLVAGNETTTKLLSSGILLLLQQPDVMARVRADYSVIPPFVEEVLRLEPPVMAMFRYATAATEVCGVPIPEGSDLWLVFSSANRDDAEFPEAAKVDLTRSNATTHLSFSQGPHYCVGAALSRAETRIAFETLLDRLADLELAPGNTLDYDESYMFHGLKELHITFRRR
ncbi:MAG: cytochrome P450 [Acidimicrobiales bacterium]